MLRRVRSIRVSLDAGRAVAAIGFAGMRVAGQTAIIGDEPLPDGVSFAGWIAWPSHAREIDMDTPIDDQIRTLHESGIVGRLDAARFDAPGATAYGYPRYSWLIKTHAGSEAERATWLIGLLS